MDKLYSIGETAKIMGLSVQTLRNYSKFPFLQPAYINTETGYRYYRFEQFHIIDRIKYLRSFDLSLSEIEEIMMDGKKLDKMISFLEKREMTMKKQIRELEMQLQDLNWYIDYFKSVSALSDDRAPQLRYHEKRYILVTDCTPEESVEEIEVRLAMEKAICAKEGVTFRRQFGYLLDYNEVLNRQWKPNGYYIFLSDVQKSLLEKEFQLKYRSRIMELPAGQYLCFGVHLRHMEELNTHLIKKHMKHIKAPSWIMANEYEDNLEDYKYCPYQMQILIEEK